MTEEEQRTPDFVDWLQSHSHDRGLMAELRRGLNPDTEWQAWKHLASWCDITNTDQRRAHAAVGGAFASHPEAATSGNLGDSLRAIATKNAQNPAEALHSFEARFRRLLTCETVSEVAERLGAVVQATKQRQIPVNYRQLLIDLKRFRWPEGRERVKVGWAGAFWRPSGTKSDAVPVDTGEAA